MPYTSLPSLNPGDPLRDSYVDQIDENLDDHETRIVALEGAGGGPGDVVGPAIATDNALVRFDGTTGELIQNSGITVADGASGTLAGSNSGDVTLAGTPDYLTLAGQVLTRSAIDLATDVTGDIPFANLTPATAASRLLGRGSSAGAGDYQEIILGANLSMSGTTINASGGAGGGDVTGPPTSVDGEIVLFDSGTGTLLKRATGTGPVKATSGVYSTGDIDLTAEVTGELPFANIEPLSASKLAGRGSAGGTGDIQEITLGTNLSMAGATLNATAGAGGGLVLLEQHTAAASASLDFTSFISSTYDCYTFVLVDVLPATSTDDLWIRMGTGGGPTWDSGSNYTWAFYQHSQLPNSANLGSTSNAPLKTAIKIGNSLGNGSTHGSRGEAKLFSPQSTSVYKTMTVHVVSTDSSGNFASAVVSGQYDSTTAVTGVRFLFSSGNITSGTIRVYGLVK